MGFDASSEVFSTAGAPEARAGLTPTVFLPQRGYWKFPRNSVSTGAIDLTQSEWDIEVYQAMKTQVLAWFPGDHELAHDAAVDRWLEFRRKTRGRIRTRAAITGWCLHFLKQRCWRICQRRRSSCRTIPSELVERNSAGQTQSCVGIYQSLQKLHAEHRVLLERWAYEGESDRQAAERHAKGRNCSLEAARKAFQRRRTVALDRLRLQYLADERQAIA